jgi:hypothetical protein
MVTITRSWLREIEPQVFGDYFTELKRFTERPKGQGNLTKRQAEDMLAGYEAGFHKALRVLETGNLLRIDEKA